MPLGEDRKVILEKYGPYVRSLAATVRKQFNAQLELDELLAYGQIGLLEAAERFDPKVGANFLTFAHYRIKGAIFDGLRKMGVLRGADARTAYQGERATAYLGNLADREQGASNRGSSFDDDIGDISDAVAGLAAVFAAGAEGAEAAGYVDESLPADQRLEMEQLKNRVRSAIEKLPEKERKLLQGYYFQGRTLEEAGAEIGQSKSWASRLHARAIDRLKELLNEEEELPPPSTDARRVSHGGSDERHLRGTGSAAKAAGSGRAADAAEDGRVEVRRSSR
ncbi:sigma-70 family RNA polymerase sigma factor [Corallococcus sp. CA049B]|uniref:sigma-70 family RNA polymerase sigma factor n=1 Tax=Corallococcus sp. CA049B TaxID=2316730 RepID=UPI000EA10D34|nr:sigma-70 family RNA polymerase sigma factor [Corallococcus sp. CA049B]NOJ96956.1 sigma-70 family RNA polymerase sigma factor [Corallococcus coralloides]RKG74298.1 sigma-70 family RNA polymerase sigma factor [Corallococcus sp. CA049B]